MIEPLNRIRVRITGNVQGVGMRPFVWLRATQMNLTGWVQNDSAGVTIEVQGDQDRIAEFVDGFRHAAPTLASIDSMETIRIDRIDESEFRIRASTRSASDSTPVSADISVCDDCLGELHDKDDRRFRYPFINCTNCGPRFSIILDIPYDRMLTTMKSFEMCAACRREYSDPSNRRFHAQPNACADCGPSLWLVDCGDPGLSTHCPPRGDDRHSQAIDAFARAIRQGQIVAVKGIGGFHLACGATNIDAIGRLRERKGRINKPFAVMVADSNQAEAFAVITDAERRLLESRERPIVLLDKRETVAGNHSPSAGDAAMLDAVAPGNRSVGVMLPYSPLHHLLIEQSGPLLMTSGNLSDEPIARSNSEALLRLRPLADSFLFHDREIHVACDDSVVRQAGATVLPIRRSRGFAPIPVKLAEIGPSVLALGGDLKSTFCVTKADNAYLSQHIGDLANIETLNALKDSVQHFLKLFRIEIEAIAADLHPNYLSSRWAAELAHSMGVPLLGIQHHFAHAASLQAESAAVHSPPILACCFDGTGYGDDGAIWGGEFLITDGQGFDRFAHLQYAPLPGGDTCIKRPYRTALALLDAYQLPWDDRLPCVGSCPKDERRVLKQQLKRNLNCAPTSSIGRLFDSVASIIGTCHRVNYEAQAAIELETQAASATGHVNPTAYGFEVDSFNPVQIGCRSLLARICQDVIRGIDRRTIAAQFQQAVVSMVVNVSVRARQEHGIDTVGLTGGVFQNIPLVDVLTDQLGCAGFKVLTHSLVPPGDGGLSLGQAVIARNRLRQLRSPEPQV